jgi:3-isopropylmalate dehydrogenase
MMLRYSFGQEAAANEIEAAVESAVKGGTRTGDIAFGGNAASTSDMEAAIIAGL